MAIISSFGAKAIFYFNKYGEDEGRSLTTKFCEGRRSKVELPAITNPTTTKQIVISFWDGN